MELNKNVQDSVLQNSKLPKEKEKRSLENESKSLSKSQVARLLAVKEKCLKIINDAKDNQDK